MHKAIARFDLQWGYFYLVTADPLNFFITNRSLAEFDYTVSA